MPQGERRFAAFLQRVNAIVAEHAAFRCGGSCQFVDNEHPAVIAAVRMNPDPSSGGFLVVCNFDIHGPQQVTFDLSAAFGIARSIDGRELLSGHHARFTANAITLSLQPCETMVWQMSGSV